MNQAPLYVYLLFYSVIMSQKSDFYTIDFLPPLFLLFFYTKKELLEIVRTLAKLNIFILFVVAFVGFSGEWEKAGAILLRSNLVLLFALLIFHKSDLFEIARVAAFYKLPAKLTLLLYFSARFVYILKNETNTVLNSLKSRGFESSFGIFTYKTYGYALGAIIRKSYIRMEESSLTLKARGYDNNSIFFLPYSKNYGVKDGTMLSLFILFLAVNLYVLLS